MRSLFTAVLAASVFGPLTGSAFAADLDYPYAPAPPAYEEPPPVPPAFIPERVPPVLYRAPVVYPRPVLRVYPRPYPYYGPRPVVRVYPELRAYPRPYAEGDADRPFPREARPYPEPGYERGTSHEAAVDRHEREGYGRGYEREDERHAQERFGQERLGQERFGQERSGQERYGQQHDGQGRNSQERYGHYLSRDELDRRAAREHGVRHDDHYADRDLPPRDNDR